MTSAAKITKLSLLTSLSTQKLLPAIVFIAIFTMAVRPPADTDTWWHLRSGQYMVENWTIFTADPFSHTRTGQSWYYPKLGQVVWYLIYALGGWAGLSLGLAILVTASFALVWLATPGNLYLRAFATILGAITSSVIWVARPQMLSFLLAALVLLLLERYKRAGSRGIYLLPVITALWASVHGGYAIALMLAGAYLIGETINQITRHSDDPVLSWSQIGQLAAVIVVSFLSVAINPHGWRMWLYPFQTVGIDVLREFIQEWRSPNFHMPVMWSFILMLLLTLMAMGRSTRQVDWSDLTMVGLWVGWSLFASRNVGLYGLLMVPVLARYSEAVLGKSLPGGERLPTKQQARLNGLLLGLIVIAAITRVGVTLLDEAKTPQEQGLPVEAVNFLQEHQSVGPIFNSYNWGGYLIFALWPKYPVYIDGRTDLYDDSFIRRYLTVMAAEAGWQKTLDEDGINLVLVEPGSLLARFLSFERGWQEIYRDDVAIIFARVMPVP
jgi:hypothetical protein